MRILAPVLGPIATADMRLLIAGAALTLFFKTQKYDLQWKRNWKQYLIIGLLNTGISFLLFSFAALYLPASVSVILNSLTPMFAALTAVMWVGEKLHWKVLAGIFLGISGVAIIRWGGSFALNEMTTLAMGAGVLATLFYGVGTVYVKIKAQHLSPQSIAAGSQLVMGLLFFPLIILSPPHVEITSDIIFMTLAFSLLCSAIAYLIFYRLIKSLGPVKTTTVTFLIPVFGFIWGAMFLHEEITIKMIVGALVVLSGTAFVTGKRKTQSS